MAILCEVLTDNRNRTAPEIRKIFELSDGKLGGTGCVAWMFETKGMFIVPAGQVDEEKLLEIALEAGADDVKPRARSSRSPATRRIYPRGGQGPGRRRHQARGQPRSPACPRTPWTSTPTTARKVLKLMERLDDHDDVQNVASNFNIPDEVMAEIGEE